MILLNPCKAFAFNSAVAHLQNRKLQEKIKIIIIINVSNTPRNCNKCDARLSILIFGTLGEIVETAKYINY